MPEKLRITREELKDPKVDEIIEEQSAYKKSLQTTGIKEAQKVSLIHKSWFNLMIAGLIGALLAWGMIEPYVSDIGTNEEKTTALFLLMFLSVGGCVGLMIGGMEGVLARNFRRAFKSALIGLAVGFGGGLAGTFAAGIVLQLFIPFLVAIVGVKALMDPAHHFSGFIGFVIFRSLAWTVLGMGMGLGPGIALKSKKLTLNGFLGGMIGGAIGGMLFDPIDYIVSKGWTIKNEAELSRAIGFAVVGATVGLMIGLVEMLTKDAWLLMTEGPLRGKQFIIYKNPTIIGGSPKCEVYLFKDPSIEPQHAAIHILRDGYILEDKNTQSGTFVNGRKIKKKRLYNGDEIQIGKIKFIYSEREREEEK